VTGKTALCLLLEQKYYDPHSVNVVLAVERLLQQDPKLLASGYAKFSAAFEQGS
jgi:hypothetical protein